MKKIGIIGAMSEEVEALKSMIENKSTRKVAGLEFNEGYIYDKNIVVVECGISKVNAAMCTQILISEFGVDAIINTGVAGGLHEDLNINDVVISTDAIQYDVDASAVGDPVGTIPRMETSVFKADERLIELAEKAFSKEKREYKVLKGRVVTGDRFVADYETKTILRDKFGGYCCEMEGGSIAHVSHCNKVPFVIIRAISDNADSSADITFDEFVIKAAITSKNMVLGMLRNL